jgi:hypothetical protein
MLLKAGSINEMTDSMALAMENAFLQEWPKVMSQDQPVPPPNSQMRLLFIAVAQGIVRHLTDHAEGIHVTLGSSTAAVSIQHTGTLY